MDLVGKNIGNYKFLSVLGEGGMAVVYLVENVMLNSLWAIKVLKPEFINNLSIRKRFLDEGKKLGKIQNQHIVKVYDVIEKNDFVALVMEYLEGQTLKQFIEKKTKKNNTEIYRFLEQILIALQAVHDAGFIHRDIKPSNIMLSKSGEIKLTDFGIAKDLNDFSHTTTNTQMGTPIYMSPEQIRNSKHIDHRSDIFSLGVVLYELIADKFPYDKNLSLTEIQYKILNKSIPATNTIWDKYISKATSKDLVNRFQNCSEWLASLKHDSIFAIEETISVEPSEPPRNSSIKVVLFILRILIGGFLAYLYFINDNENLIPKPPTHLTVNLPEHSYKAFDDSSKYSFEMSKLWSVRENLVKNDSLILYLGKEIDGDIHFQYAKIDSTNTLSNLLNVTFAKIDFHKIRARQMLDTNFIFKDKKVYGSFFEFIGNSATNFQFYLTDSTNHFVRSELLIRRKPNYDSLQPTLHYIKKDLYHLINTFNWKN